jgi:hypothetical protein
VPQDMPIHGLQLHHDSPSILRLPGIHPNGDTRGTMRSGLPLSRMRHRVSHDHYSVPNDPSPDANTDAYPTTADHLHTRRHQRHHTAARTYHQHAVPRHHKDHEPSGLPWHPVPYPNVPDSVDAGNPMQLHAQDTALRSGVPDRVLRRMSDEDGDCQRRQVLRKEP